jgi:P-type Ca2+ transporter type 2C
MTLNEAEINNIQGLTETEAQNKLAQDGFNELPGSHGRSIIKIVIGVFKEPMFLLLVACGTIYLLLGDVAEAVLLLGFVFVIMFITIYQENKTEKALTALRNLSSPRALVIRDGKKLRIPGREVVKDDILMLQEGDRVPADAIVLWGRNVMADESLLTGESVPVRKMPSHKIHEGHHRPGGDDLPYLYSGTMVVQGQGLARVTAISMHTEIGKIGKTLQHIEERATPLQQQTGRLVRTIFSIAVTLSFIIIVVYGMTRGDWIQAILSGITLAMSILPEEFPVILTVFLALGAWRIAKQNVLTRKMSAVEVLGSATVLCVDKTGTLTENKMSVKILHVQNETYNVAPDHHTQPPEKFHELIEYGILASKKDPFDPMEKALNQLGQITLHQTEHLHNSWPLIEEYPLSRNLLALSQVWAMPNKNEFIISTKGAPEAIFDLCHLTDAEVKKITSTVQHLAGKGLRLIGVAKASFSKAQLPASQHDFDFKFIGLIGLADPIRATVPPAISECYRAGIRVVMITGDYPVTAQNIARQIGLQNPDEVITGAELEKMSLVALQKRIATVNVFARVVPEQKLMIVDALKKNDEIVAMTGDGVNDAPALKSAHIGIAMGQRGTDVARETSDLVLLDDNFSTIEKTVRLGRRIYDNLKKAMAYTVSVHVPIAGIALIPVLFGWPIVLFPAHIVFLELIIDPACSIVFESEREESDIMRRPPRSSSQPLFSRQMLSLSFLQGLFSLVVVLIVFKVSLMLGQTEGQARALTFVSLVATNIALILTNRSWSKHIFSSLMIFNKSLAWVIASVVLCLSLVLYVPFLKHIFSFAAISPISILIATIGGLISIAWFEIIKIIYARNKHERLL